MRVDDGSTPFDTKERYPGTRGSTHGETNEIAPASAAVANPIAETSIATTSQLRPNPRLLAARALNALRVSDEITSGRASPGASLHSP